MRSVIALFCALAAGSVWGDTPRAAESADSVRPLLIGASAPSVSVRTADGATVELGDVLARQPTILIFYRGGW